MPANVLVELDTGLQSANLRLAEAELENMKATLLKLQRGPRQEEIAIAQAKVAGAEARLADAEATYAAMPSLSRNR